MFQQADDTKLFLIPFDLSDSSFAEQVKSKNPVPAHQISDAGTNIQKLIADFHAALALPDQESAGKALSAFTNAAGLNLIDAYAHGVTCFREVRYSEAINVFTILSSYPEICPPVLTALAACACHEGQYQFGHAFAERSIALKELHPRAHLLSGYCALQLGDNKNAKRQLALATRLARSDARHRKEQRCAQRELLLMQLAT